MNRHIEQAKNFMSDTIRSVKMQKSNELQYVYIFQKGSNNVGNDVIGFTAETN